MPVQAEETEMQDTAILTNVASGEEREFKPASARRILLAACGLMALALCALAWVHLDGTQAFNRILSSSKWVHARADVSASSVLLKLFDQLVWRTMLVIGGGGAALLLTLLGGLAIARRGWIRRLRVVDEQWRARAAKL